jgi:hypothetical protein
LRPCGCLRQSRAPVVLHELTETLTHQENVMQTLKNHFNYKARQRNIDIIVLYMLLLLLIAKYDQLKSDIAYKVRNTPRPTFRPR